MRIILVLTALLAGPAAASEAPSSEALARALDAQPGVTVTQGNDGGQSYTEWRRNGVSYRRQRRGEQEQWIGDDESGAGAVMCTWGIYVTLRAALDECPAERFSALRDDLSRDISAMEAFIVANSPLPVTKESLGVQAAALRDQSRRARPASEAPACATGDIGMMLRSIDEMGPGGRHAMMDKLLATPRWPVLNPCL
jgi:hypothetical protein